MAAKRKFSTDNDTVVLGPTQYTARYWLERQINLKDTDWQYHLGEWRHRHTGVTATAVQTVPYGAKNFDLYVLPGVSDYQKTVESAEATRVVDVEG